MTGVTAEPEVEPSPPPRLIGNRPYYYWWWWAGMVCLAACLFLASAGTSNTWPFKPFLAFGMVIRSTGLAIKFGWTGLAAWLVCGILYWARGEALRDWYQTRSRRQRIAGNVAIGMIGPVALAASCAMLWASICGGFTAYYVLSPRSPNGCTVVVGASAGLRSGSGNVYVVNPGSASLRFVSDAWDWSEDDPMATGDWSLSWDGADGLLRIRQAEIPVHCPR